MGDPGHTILRFDVLVRHDTKSLAAFAGWIVSEPNVGPARTSHDVRRIAIPTVNAEDETPEDCDCFPVFGAE
jgi:hypothetical protein